MVQSSRSLPPGPNSLSAWQLLRYSHSPLPFLEDCARRYGTPFTTRWAGYGTFVMLASSEAVKDVFRGNSHALHSGEGNEFLSASVGKNSVLVLDDEQHTRQRRVLLPPLKGERMRSFFDPMQTITLELLETWSPGQMLAMIEPMQEITLNVMLQVVLGMKSSTKSPFVAGGREYPAGVVLCPCSHLVHQREDLYPEPQTFRPERFLERHYSADEWFPFGGGGRLCLGMAFAIYEMKIVLSTLFSKVSLSRPPGCRSFPVRRGIAIAPSDGVIMRVSVNPD